jgi:hypothetical protein
MATGEPADGRRQLVAPSHDDPAGEVQRSSFERAGPGRVHDPVDDMEQGADAHGLLERQIVDAGGSNGEDVVGGDPLGCPGEGVEEGEDGGDLWPDWRGGGSGQGGGDQVVARTGSGERLVRGRTELAVVA